MSLMRQTLRPNIASLWLAVLLVCALLVSQFGLTEHVVEHSASPVIAAQTIDQDAGTSEQTGCPNCLEYQAHGSGLLGQTASIAVVSAHAFAVKALAPNTPYLAPERASQRAPPVLS